MIGALRSNRHEDRLRVIDEPLASANPSPMRLITSIDGSYGPIRRSLAASRVKLERVCFRYEPANSMIADFGLDVSPGQTVAIVGPAGAGETTMVNPLVRFYKIDSGRITLRPRPAKRSLVAARPDPPSTCSPFLNGGRVSA